MKYKIQFIDDTWFSGGDYRKDSKWNEIPDKKIKQLVYIVGRKKITLSGFKAYNHIIEKTRLILKGREMITKVMIMALYKDTVYRLIFDLNKRKFSQDLIKLGREYNEKPTTGWKKGTDNTKPKVVVT